MYMYMYTVYAWWILKLLWHPKTHDFYFQLFTLNTFLTDLAYYGECKIQHSYLNQYFLLCFDVEYFKKFISLLLFCCGNSPKTKLLTYCLPVVIPVICVMIICLQNLYHFITTTSIGCYGASIPYALLPQCTRLSFSSFYDFRGLPLVLSLRRSPWLEVLLRKWRGQIYMCDVQDWIMVHLFNVIGLEKRCNL